MKIVEYSLLTDESPRKLVVEVQKAIDEGWQPYGSPCAAVAAATGSHGYPVSGWAFSQAMVKYEEPRAPDSADAIGQIERMSLIDAEVSKRVKEYKKYWNAEKSRYEIEVGTKAEWVCSEDELYDDVRRSVEGDFADKV